MRRLIHRILAHDLLLLGSRLFLAACLMLGLAQLYLGELLPPFETLGPASRAMVALSSAMLAIPSIWRLVRPASAAASVVLSLYWATATTLGIAAHADMLSWVPVTETWLFAIVSLHLAWPPASRTGRATAIAACLSSASALLFFGFVHLSNPAGIGGLIPQWISGAEYWPYVTGLLLVAAGIGMLTRKLSSASAMMIAAMFSSWIIVLHLERLLLEPNSMFEWNFALTALALAGAVLASARPFDPS